MIRQQNAGTTLGRWLVVGSLVFALASATALPVAAQSSGGSDAAAADPAAVDPAMMDAEQAQAADAAPAVAPAPKPTVAPVQFGPTGC